VQGEAASDAWWDAEARVDGAAVDTPAVSLVAIVVMALSRVDHAAPPLNDARHRFEVGEVKDLDAGVAVRAGLADGWLVQNQLRRVEGLLWLIVLVRAIGTVLALTLAPIEVLTARARFARGD